MDVDEDGGQGAWKLGRRAGGAEAPAQQLAHTAHFVCDGKAAVESAFPQ
jgi:hypothetical protein